MRALISVSDKTGVVGFAKDLHVIGAQLISTGGTFTALQEAGIPVKKIADVTGSPEILDGRVKTLHPRIHGGILARRDIPDHLTQLSSQGIDPIDLVCVNLYPFVQTVRKPRVTIEEALENIDIGGPTLLRAAAKNHPAVIVLVDPDDYSWVLQRLHKKDLSQEERKYLAWKAFSHVATYDSAIATYLSPGTGGETLPSSLVFGLEKVRDLRYGENPHQKAALYSFVLGSSGIVDAQQLHGKELSYNNILDAEAAWRTVSDYDECAVAVVKHTNPCGLAIHRDQAEAYRRAYSGDPVSAFGGIVACNRQITTTAAQEMTAIFYEIIVAPGFEPEALNILKKKKNLRLLAVATVSTQPNDKIEVHQVSGGVLVQTEDTLDESPSQWRVVTDRSPTAMEMQDLSFAWKAAKHIKSNAIVLAHDNALIGMGAGQPNRVVSVHLAIRSAGEGAVGSVLASDAFFPFPDGIEEAARGGVTAVIQPGGSIRDDLVLEAANRLGIAMVFTGVRHFRH
jgi:phosphoribosylaminoimidazolecarboxamide formyltransferase/IMP cyclohydrolase